MRYEYHNFTENFKAVQNTKDINMTREILLSELTKVIAGKKDSKPDRRQRPEDGTSHEGPRHVSQPTTDQEAI